MEFKEFNALLRKHVLTLTKDQNYLFVVDLESDAAWNTYLDSFPEGMNEIFRERREYDCSCCRHFIRDFGRVVLVRNQKVTSIWDFETGSDKYQPVVDAMSALVKSRPVANVFVSDSKNFGTGSSPEYLEDGSSRDWHHLSASVESLAICARPNFGSVQGGFRDVRNVFKRSLDEISPEAVSTVLELIAQNSLYKGEEWRVVLDGFKSAQTAYLKVRSLRKRALYCWEGSVKVGEVLGKIRNHSIGVLLTDISEGMELDEAVRKYEAMVAPSNYKRPKAIFTKKMVTEAQKTVKELGFENSLGRRFAKMEDITVNNTLFANRDSRMTMAKDVFEELAATVPEKPKNLSKVEEISINRFVADVLPTASSVEVLLENHHLGNMVSLIAPSVEGSKSMLKWNNNFSWAYSGNITDSMKQHVKSAGGKVDGELRFSIQWNDNGDNLDDLDAHCWEPDGNKIFFGKKRNPSTSGQLDVDIMSPRGVAVENITWSNRGKMEKGTYKFLVHCYSSRRATSGFTAEIEFDGQVHSFEYAKPLRPNERIDVAEVTFEGSAFKLKELLSSSVSSRDIWGLASNKFYPVSIATFSPNYWDGQMGIGHRHYFFMVDGCKNPETPNGFFNEFLNQDLMKHKRVFEALGSSMRAADSDNQLSGLGFSATKRAHVVCKVMGSFERMVKVIF